jgi:hypothetical protein
LGIRLDWQVEAERLHSKASESLQERRKRTRRRLRILISMMTVVGAICAVGALIWFRLTSVDNQLRQELIDTAQAETAALRIGDYAAYMNIQRSASGDWLKSQSERFALYQDLKKKSDLKLTGNALDTVVDGSRGRVLIEEEIDGVSYRTAWFYWRYADGWRHVPTDYTFWGATQTLSGKVSSVKYHQLDEPLAQVLSALVERWWSEGCGYLGCSVAQPRLDVEIITAPPGTGAQVHWETEKSYTLLVPSPLAYEERARIENELTPTLEETIAAAIAERVFDLTTNFLRPVPTADAAWIRQTTIEWLATVYVQRGDLNRLGFIQTLKDRYGPSSLSALVRALTPSADISLVAAVLKQPPEALNLDWRSFFQWRLDVEKTFLARNDRAGFQALWDLSTPAAQQQMQQRMARPAQATPQVQDVAIGKGSDGKLQAMVQATAENKPQTIIFRMVNGTWKRSA